MAHTMDVDIEPIYCVEQIQIPAGLPEMLKNFAKEAIRSQPPHLEEFAADYFSLLYKMTKLDSSAPPPTLVQLQRCWEELRGIEFMSQDAIESACAAHGVPRAALKKVFTLHDFKSDLVDPKEVVVLLLTCLAQSFVAVLRGIFEIFGLNNGGKISVALFLKLLSFLSKRDRDITPQCISNLTAELLVPGDKPPEITYTQVKNSPHMLHFFVTPSGGPV